MQRRHTSEDAFQFAGFRLPTYTMVPDELFDQLLIWLTGAELKALLYIIRRTFGFKKDADSISLSQMLNGITTHDGEPLDYGAGLSKPTLLQALRSLQEKGIILTERRRSIARGDEPTVYRLRFAGETPGKKSILPVVKKFDQGGGQETSPGPWSRKLPTQETDRQKTVLQERDKISNTPDFVRLDRSAHADENVDNSRRRPTKGSGGRPSRRRPQNGITPTHTNSHHDGIDRLPDPTGGEELSAISEVHPVVVKQGRGSRRLSQDREAGVFHDGVSLSAIAAVDPMKTVARGSQRVQATPAADPLQAESTGAAMPRGVATIGTVLAGRDGGETAVVRPGGPKQGRIGSEGSEIGDRTETPSESRPGRATGLSEYRRRIAVPDYIKHVVTDFSAELHDDEHTRANLSRATRLWQQSGLEEPVFVQEVLYRARAIARKQAGVKKRSAAGGLVNRMPYFFAVVEDLMGLRDGEGRRAAR